ncbi:MAG TPA: hypothetical protein VFH66_11860 [Mycobacteriales bacterium]|nr:hypothetical protein [Mycobacteriales bacterium]
MSPSKTPRLVALAASGVLLISCGGHGSQPGASSPPATRPAATASTASPAPATPTSTPSPPARLVAHVAPWQLPAARSREVALATAGGLVVAGGLSSAKVSTSTVWSLSAANGRAAHTGSLATAVHDAAGFVVGRTAFVVGGGNTSTVDDVQEIATEGSAQVVGHLPQPRSDLSAASVEGAGYALGGFDGTASLAAVLRTADGRRFSTVAQLPVTVRYAAVAAVAAAGGDDLLVFGGEHDGVAIDDVQQVDLKTGRARIIGHLPHPLAHEGAAVLGDSVWLLGGRSHDQLQSAIWRWDPTRRRAVAAGRLPYAVADAGVAVIGSTAYVLGGETPDPTARVIVVAPR